jgi:hypothetical protein
MEYGFNMDSTHAAIIYEIGSDADSNDHHLPETNGLIVGSSEWGWISEANGERICAALNYFDGISTEEIKELIKNKEKL